jgi:hypothetical protein
VIVSAWALSSLLPIAWAGPKPEGHHKTLDQPEKIQGYPCAKGDAWFFADGKLEHCTVSHAIAFGEATIPEGSWITLAPEGKPRIAQMSHDTDVHGYHCAGSGWLPPAEGSMVSFYPSGKLEECFLTVDQTVQGVPCSHGGFWKTTLSGDPSLKFREDGTLASCMLARDYGGQKRGQRYKKSE